jgi:CubicO group peptidase (beta-lactamase class C family)
LDQPVSSVLPAFSGTRKIQPYEDPLHWDQWVAVAATGSAVAETVDAGRITFRQLLSHTAGLPAWRPLFQQANATAARKMALETFFSCPPGGQVVYSDIGIILLGMAVEVLSGMPLDQAIEAKVITPLSLSQTGFLPLPEDAEPSLKPRRESEPANIAPTELCKWRGRRLAGEVHDENAWRLGGVSGHAGIFSTAGEIARFGQAFLDGGRPFLSATSVAEMTRLQAEHGNLRRGLGFVLWSPDPEASSHPFSPSTFGHTGFTGTSLWIDPQRELVVALLTNDVYDGREGRGIMKLRVRVHQEIVEVIRRQ